jgi:hypothetical protein
MYESAADVNAQFAGIHKGDARGASLTGYTSSEPAARSALN